MCDSHAKCGHLTCLQLLADIVYSMQGSCRIKNQREGNETEKDIDDRRKGEEMKMSAMEGMASE